MPAKSKAQARLMNAAAHNQKFAKEVGIKPSIAKEFAADGAQYKRLPERKRQGKPRGG